MSPFGILHTTISVLPIGFGLAAFIRDGKIDLKTKLGKWYFGTMLAGSVSSLGFIITKGFTPGQVLTIVTLGLLAAAVLTVRGQWRKPGYIQTISLSASYLMLWVFTTTETLMRLPKGEPFASGPNDPALLPVRLMLLGLFVIVIGYQAFRIRESRRVETNTSIQMAVA
jgi:uncharacterized membrane protein YvlD (DUF360 family)